jgi:hypothetical protein
VEKAYLYIVLTRTNTVISHLIRLFTQDEYTHAALSLDSYLQEMYSFGRKHTHNPFLGRFKQERLEHGVYGLAKHLPGVILELEVSPENYAQAAELIDQFRLNHGKYKYNLRGLLYGLVNRPTTRTDRFLCSQFVYYILHESGVVDFHTPASLVRPVDFLEMEARIAYQGDLKKFATVEGPCPVQVRLYHWIRDILWISKAS